MNLFGMVPDNFFNILTGKAKKEYADCIYLMYNFLGKGSSFGAYKEEIVSILTEYYESYTSLELEEESLSPREAALYTLRKLKACGWIFEEDDVDYTVLINFHHYAIPIIKSLEEVTKNEKLEYQGYIYLIYAAVKNIDGENLFLLLEQIHHNTTIFMNRLKTLNANIKKYIDDLLTKKDRNDLKSIVLNLFIEYKSKIIDAAYLRLKTSDNVSRFRPYIISKLNELCLDSELIERVSSNLVQINRFPDTESGKAYIFQLIEYIIKCFESLDEIISEIDKKNTKYIQTSVSKIMFLVNNSYDLQGKIKGILGFIGNEKRLKTDDLFSLFNQKYLDERSLYTMPTRYEVALQEITTTRLNEEEKEDRIKNLLNKEKLTKQYIIEHVKELLKNKRALKASETSLLTINDYVRLILICLYSNSASLYKIEKLDYQYSYNAISFTDFEIAKNEESNDG